MPGTGPIVVIEDDTEDKEILEEVLHDLHISNKLIWFNSGEEALQFLQTTSEQPFIIFSDINLRGQSAVYLKKRIDEDPRLRKKSIPFVFYSTSVDQVTANEVYLGMTVQGYFRKGARYEDIKNTIKVILDYWQVCYHPNTK